MAYEFKVTDYGAVFNGTTDDKASIQAAVDAAAAAGGGVVEMPAGTAKVSNVINLHPKITLRGQGGQSTKLKTTATSGALPGGSILKLNSASDDYVKLEGFELEGHGEGQTSGSGISFQSGGVKSFHSFKDLYIHGFPTDGLYIDDPILCSFERVWVRDCGRDGLSVNLGTSCSFKQVYASGCNRSGIHLKSSTYMNLEACAAEYDTFGYWLEGSGNITMNACGGEVAMRADGGTAGAVAHYRLQGCKNIIVNACYSSKFAYLNSVPAYHWYITDSKKVILNAIRGKAPLGGDDPGEAPTHTISIDSTSTVHANSITFETQLGGGQSGAFKSEILESGEYIND